MHRRWEQTSTVKDGGRVEVVVPTLHEGEVVTVFISAPDVSGHEKVSDFLRRLPAGARSKADIDLQLRAERDSWGER